MLAINDPPTIVSWHENFKPYGFPGLRHASISTNRWIVRVNRSDIRNYRLQGTPFSLGWEVALECGMHQLAHAVMDRALNGVEVEHYYHGELVATTRRYDNRLAQWVLEHPWIVGRNQMGREYVAGNFDALLERIEAAGLDWEDGDTLPGPGWPHDTLAEAQRREGQFFKDSWYAAHAGTADLSAKQR